VQRGRIFSWREYIEHIKFTLNYDWLSVLKVALEIFNGDLKGYAQVPDEKDLRERLLQPYMKDLLKQSITTVIHQFKNKSSSAKETKTEFEADSIAIKVAIEFCLNIAATEFLFKDIFSLFQ